MGSLKSHSNNRKENEWMDGWMMDGLVGGWKDFSLQENADC